MLFRSNDTFEHEYTGEKDYGYSMLGGESKNPAKVKEKIEAYVNKLKKSGLDKEDFDRIKNKQMGEHLSYYNSVEFIATTFIAYHFHGVNIFEYIEKLKDMEFSTVEKRFMDHFNNERCILSIISPK